jgi:CubicO group peptidase (beta-lactamase class C family)
MNIEQVLVRLKLDTRYRARAVQDVRERIEQSADPFSTARALFEQLTMPNTPFTFTDIIEARVAIAYMVQQAIVKKEQYDPETIVANAIQYVKERRETAPWIFVKDAVVNTSDMTQQHGVGIRMNANGGIKKGSKQVLAVALYEKNKSLSNKDLVALFEKELGMSTAGARTYAYNAKHGKFNK